VHSGDGYALTIDNLIVFNRDPGNDLFWWAHEELRALLAATDQSAEFSCAVWQKL